MARFSLSICDLLEPDDIGCKIQQGPHPDGKMGQEQGNEPVPGKGVLPAKDDGQDKCNFMDRMRPDPEGLEVDAIFSFEQLE